MIIHDAHITIHHPHYQFIQGACNTCILLSIHLIKFQKMSDAKRKENGENKNSTLAERMDYIPSPYYIPQIMKSALMILY